MKTPLGALSTKERTNKQFNGDCGVVGTGKFEDYGE